jgi:hypothetical protein
MASNSKFVNEMHIQLHLLDENRRMVERNENTLLTSETCNALRDLGTSVLWRRAEAGISINIPTFHLRLVKKGIIYN